ncbi:hypothetical protein CF123_17790 [Aeromonas veronii]|uniref:Uncharacterized protein n=1 Tax=Aeromonas veronii TaxID=654 RepID=A0AAX2UPT0_AERVE|nr:hypothetical protein [Aeromonas veronii]TND51970.1 hypothetical protein CF123_17790 [Aeromonas veronii]
MIAVTNKVVLGSMKLAKAYLVSEGYTKVKRQWWMRGSRHAAVIESSPTGRAIVKEGVNA